MRICIIITILSSLIFTSRAQTNVIEWQTNWPAGGSNNLVCGNEQNLPTSSAWFTGTKAAVQGVPTADGTATNLVSFPGYSSGSQTFYTYFAPTMVNTNRPSPYTVETNSGSPISLSPNETIRATVNFQVFGTAVQNPNRSLRFGLMYAGTNANVSGGGNGTNNYLTGYGQNLNFGTTFGQPPLQTFANTNSVDNKAQLSTTKEFAQIGANGGGTTNDPGFTDGINYTLIMSITENNPTNVTITTTFLGSTFSNGASITLTDTDTNYCYTNFDEFIMRPALAGETATNFTFTSFKIETILNNPFVPSTNAYLSSLAVSTTGALTPAFASNQLSYSASEVYNGSPTITPTSADTNATINIIYNGTTNAITSGTSSAPLTLNPDLSVPNVADVQVTAQDGLTVMDYLVTITQQPSLSEPTLTNIWSPGALQLSWPPDHLGYRLLVQTNNQTGGISTNPSDWGTVAGSTTTNMAVVPIIPGQPVEFYRLVYP
ncbi:MAG TPA: cadherin-like beta sandwich domain-containing protein [Candidatus Acidoferrum sp.]|nr:cadherin-like beta sandwich domain-containing protein [Candidatus Acidoferrum sp.]